MRGTLEGYYITHPAISATALGPTALQPYWKICSPQKLLKYFRTFKLKIKTEFTHQYQNLAGTLTILQNQNYFSIFCWCSNMGNVITLRQTNTTSRAEQIDHCQDKASLQSQVYQLYQGNIQLALTHPKSSYEIIFCQSRLNNQFWLHVQ